jgi:glutaminase
MPTTAMEACLQRVHRALLDDTSGAVAGYIPELATVDPEPFGIAVATVDGHVHGVGDDDAEFTIQSISKPFVYGLALDDHGVERVLERVGVEPSGEAFNSIVMDERNNRPMNPMVNAGAIACAAMVRGDGLDERRRRVLDTFARYAGRPLGVDRAVAESERRTGHRNRAIAYLELSTGMIDEPVEEHLDLYFDQCSINVTARDLAMMAATLANGGVNPVTGERALEPENVARVLSVMATCGMYDWSGEWMFRIGLPAKSGVGGGIIAVLPGQLGMGTFSPRLDEFGNSVRGVRACEEVVDLLNLHMLDATATAAPVVSRRYTAAEVSSRRVRRAGDADLIRRSGAAVTVLQLQGDLFFATAERLVRTIEHIGDDTRVVVLDARRAGRATAGAVALLAVLHEQPRTGPTLLLAGAGDGLLDALAAEGGAWPAEHLFVDVDLALEWAEDLVLAELAAASTATEADVADMADGIDLLVRLDDDDRAALAPLLVTERYEPGEHILREGEPADRLCLLVEGRASGIVRIGEGEAARDRRVRTFGPGTLFGEAAVLEGGLRPTDVVADEGCTVLSLGREAFAELEATRPEVYAHLVAGLARSLSELLHQAVDELRALGD